MGLVEGIVEGASAGKGLGPKWTLILRLDPWRKPGTGWTKSGVLYVHIPIGAQEATSDAARRYREGTVVQVTVGKIRPGTEYAYPSTSGKLPVKTIPADRDAKAIIERRSEPRDIRDPVLGKLSLERDYGWFAGRRKGYELLIDVADPDDDAIEKTIVGARERLSRCESEVQAIRDAATTKLLPLYNKGWRENRPKLSKGQFRARIGKLVSVQIGPRRTTLHFNARGMFTDHVIEVRIGARGKISEILIA